MVTLEVCTGVTEADYAKAESRVPNGFKQTEVGVIPEDWGVVSAFEACSKIQDGTHFSPRGGGHDYLYVTSKNVRFGHLDLSTAGWIDTAQHQANLLLNQRCDVKKGDLLLTKDGANTGNAAYFKHSSADVRRFAKSSFKRRVDYTIWPNPVNSTYLCCRRTFSNRF